MTTFGGEIMFDGGSRVRLEDVGRELAFYQNAFVGASVLCNCDVPSESNFWNYFHDNFEELGLRKLVATYLAEGFPTGKMEYFGADSSGVSSTLWRRFDGDGDFRSDECVAILRDCDVVVTRPPASSFVEFVELMLRCDKRFLILGDLRFASASPVSDALSSGRIWFGRTLVSGFCWFTNLDCAARHAPLTTAASYTPGDYSEVDEDGAILVGRVSDIPADYDGVMSVPADFLSAHCSEQFEIVRVAVSVAGGARILIRRRGVRRETR